MSLSLKGRLLLAAVCVVAAQAPLWWMEWRSKSLAAQSAKFDVTLLPMQLGGWTGSDTEIDKRLVRHVGAESIVNRVYENRQGRQVVIHLAAFSAGEFALPHPPTLCYKNAGWMGTDKFTLNDGSPPYRLMLVEREGLNAIVGYWYQVGHSVVIDRGELRQALQKLRWKGERWPPLVKVLMHLGGDPADRTAKDDAAQLGSLIFDWVQSKS